MAANPILICAPSDELRTQLESQLGSAATNVETYLSTQCGIDTEGTDTASPTS